MPRTLYCRLCTAAYDSVAGDQPAICPACGKAAHWSTEPPRDEPKRAWEITANDRRLLKSLKIHAD